RIYRRAKELAQNGVLILVVNLPDVDSHDASEQISLCVEEYTQLYKLLSHNLLPSWTGMRAEYNVTKYLPNIIVLKGDGAPLMRMLAFYVAPYITIRQQNNTASEAEIRILMTKMLDELTANDLPPESYNTLLHECVKSIAALVQMPLRQIALTNFEKQVFEDDYLTYNAQSRTLIYAPDDDGRKKD
ncbi:MAG: hypothetical protein CUN55_16010, partial [Phototrophicales bacterium]